MSGRTWVCSDHHLGHGNILKFTDKNGELLRGKIFKDIEEHDEEIIKRHNEVVGSTDRVYLLGDVVINHRFLHLLGRLSGRLVLVKGNHDIFDLKEYIPYFDDIRSYVVQKDQDGNKVILSHIPVHRECMDRWGTNIHGHLHNNNLSDKRYVNVSMEQINYTPIELHKALKRAE